MTPSLMRLTLFRTAEGSGGEKAWWLNMDSGQVKLGRSDRGKELD